jgi:hypothetical protein
LNDGVFNQIELPGFREVRHRNQNTVLPRKRNSIFQRKDAEAQRRDTNSTNPRELNGRPSFDCAEGSAEISPGFERSEYPGKSSHKIILPLLAERGEGRGEEQKVSESD